MPLLHKYNNNNFSLYVWDVSKNDIFTNINLNNSDTFKLNSLKKEINKRQFLSVRKMLFDKGIKSSDIIYNSKGKPLLKDGRFISISHSKNYSAIVISNKNIGLDIETNFNKIIKVKNKFLSNKELKLITLEEDIISAWCKKESLYKLDNNNTLKEIDITKNNHTFYIKKIKDMIICVTY